MAVIELRSIGYTLHVVRHHFGLEHFKNLLSTIFVLSFDDLLNEVPHNRVSFIVLNISNNPHLMMVGGETPNYVK